jgi:hypothetical protein
MHSDEHISEIIIIWPNFFCSPILFTVCTSIFSSVALLCNNRFKASCGFWDICFKQYALFS